MLYPRRLLVLLKECILSPGLEYLYEGSIADSCHSRCYASYLTAETDNEERQWGRTTLIDGQPWHDLRRQRSPDRKILKNEACRRRAFHAITLEAFACLRTTCRSRQALSAARRVHSRLVLVLRRAAIHHRLLVGTSEEADSVVGLSIAGRKWRVIKG